jgi:hypothetical protein
MAASLHRFRQRPLITVISPAVKTDNNDLLQIRVKAQSAQNLGQSNARRALNRKPVGSGAY